MGNQAESRTWGGNRLRVVIRKQDHVDLTPLVLICGVGLRFFATAKFLFLVFCKSFDECLVLAALARRILLEMIVEKFV